MTRLLATMMLFAVVASAGCSGGDEPDFCRNHRLFHADHAGSVGVLTIEIAEDGALRREMTLPDGSTMRDLDDDIFALTFDDDGGLRQLDIGVFDLLPELQEIEVTVVTPVTQKHFAISRQCERPIFGLE